MPICLPREIWNHIFSYDSTYHEIFQERVQNEIRWAHVYYMIRLYRYFIVDEIHPRPCLVAIMSDDAFRIRYGREDQIIRWDDNDTGSISFIIHDARRQMIHVHHIPLVPRSHLSVLTPSLHMKNEN
jgi:hypothetical protein